MDTVTTGLSQNSFQALPDGLRSILSNAVNRLTSADAAASGDITPQNAMKFAIASWKCWHVVLRPPINNIFADVFTVSECSVKTKLFWSSIRFLNSPSLRFGDKKLSRERFVEASSGRKFKDCVIQRPLRRAMMNGVSNCCFTSVTFSSSVTVRLRERW